MVYEASKPISTISFVETNKNIRKKKESRRRSIIRDFCLNTSTHALPGIARSKSLHNRLFWMISFSSFTGIMIYFIVTAIVGYFQYPTSIDISVVSEWPQHFPAVSICNFLPIQMNKFYDPFINFTTMANLTQPNASLFSIFTFANIAAFTVHRLNQNLTMEPYFFSLSSMLYFCQFNSQPCSATDFISFTSSIYGGCYTFNAKLKPNRNGTMRYVNDNAGQGVLELGLYLHSHQSAPNLYNAHGIVALIHDNTQLPLIEKAGIELAPGRKHKLGYKKRAVYFLPPPYTQCTNKASLMMQAMFQNYDGADYQYSEIVCHQLCGQVYAYEQCGCVNPYLWSGRSIVRPGTNDLLVAPLCAVEDECYRKAINELWFSSDLMAQYCADCSPQCSITDFLVQTSSLLAPPEWQMTSIKAFVENSSLPLPNNWSSTWEEEVKKNYVGVNIVCETNLVENHTQYAKTGLVDILSNIGGQTGLWIGISFLSIMEFVEMLYRLLRYEFYGIRRFLRKKMLSA